MRAVVMREFGPPRVLEPAEVEEVLAGPDEVVIDVEFANVTFVETQVRAGKPPHPSMLPTLPAILGNGVGGVAARVGGLPAGADGVVAGVGGLQVGVGACLAGRRVVASLNGTGGYAERAVSPTGRLIEVPDGVAMREAVALLADGRTALALADRAALRAGDMALSRAALAEAAAGRLRPVIGQEFELADAASAHAAIEARTTIGKTLLTVPRR